MSFAAILVPPSSSSAAAASTISLRRQYRSPSTTRSLPLLIPSSSNGHGDGGINNLPPTGGGGGNNNDDKNGHNHEHGDDEENKNREEAMMVLAETKRSVESLPKDLSAAIEAGRIPGSVVSRFLDLEKSPFFRWLMQLGGFKERLLANDLFLAKIGMECGVGFGFGVGFATTAVEFLKRKDNFFNVFCDVVMTIMRVYLPAPTVSLRPSLLATAGLLATYFYIFPDNALQIAIRRSSYSVLQRFGEIVKPRYVDPPDVPELACPTEAERGTLYIRARTVFEKQPGYVDPPTVTPLSYPAFSLSETAIAEADSAVHGILKCVGAAFKKLGHHKYNKRVRVRITGGPNGCAKLYIPEFGLGFVGDGRDSYQIWLGGPPNQAPFKDKVKIDDLDKVLEDLFSCWKRNRVGFFKQDCEMDDLPKLQNKTAHQLSLEVIRCCRAKCER